MLDSNENEREDICMILYSLLWLMSIRKIDEDYLILGIFLKNSLQSKFSASFWHHFIS